MEIWLKGNLYTLLQVRMTEILQGHCLLNKFLQVTNLIKNQLDKNQRSTPSDECVLHFSHV